MIENKLISLSSNAEGFSVIESQNLRLFLLNVVCSEIKLKTNASEINEKNIEKIINKNFNFFKNKNNRMLTRENTEILIEFLCRDNRFAYTKDDFISDEENIGYPNVYWRCVRAGSPTDVGSVHADEWFWALGHGTIPSGYTRVKTWIPIIQGEQCGLTILPGSHKKDFNYSFSLGKDGKKRPQFDDAEALQGMCSAGVCVGNAIIFNDRLLHGGISSKNFRLSVEWTSCIKTIAS